MSRYSKGTPERDELERTYLVESVRIVGVSNQMDELVDAIDERDEELSRLRERLAEVERERDAVNGHWPEILELRQRADRAEQRAMRVDQALETIDTIVDEREGLRAALTAERERSGRLVGYLRIYDHAFQSGNAVPPHIRQDAQAALRDEKEPTE